MIRNRHIPTANPTGKSTGNFLGRSPRLLLPGLWLGGVSLLSSGMALAQSVPTVVVPTATAELNSAAPGPAVHAVPDLPQLMPEFSSAPVTAPPVPAALTSAPVSRPIADSAPTVVLTERSTGCHAVLSVGQPVADPCGVPPSDAVPNVTGMTGMVVPIGFSSLNAGRIGLGSTPSLKDYYNRRLRPPGRLANSNGRLLFPLTMPTAISSVFGWRTHPLTGDRRFHSGTDLAAPLGTPVLAAYAGRVAIADFLGGYGLAVSLDHSNGTQQTLYAHLSELFVKPGEAVKQGDVIGLSGSTGNSTGPHLHFEFRQLTSEGWLALDAGEELEFALAQLVHTLTVAQSPASGKKISTNIGLQGVTRTATLN